MSALIFPFLKRGADYMFSLSQLRLESAEMLRANESRRVLHPPQSTLNLMLVSLNSDPSSNATPHANINRDELFLVTSGIVEISRYYDSGSFKARETIQEGVNPHFVFIPSGEYHVIKPISDRAVIFEIIGGLFTYGATKYISPP
jgi:cupin fold WbuC family metalloprotein